jgi:hypothetical protein
LSCQTAMLILASGPCINKNLGQMWFSTVECIT